MRGGFASGAVVFLAFAVGAASITADEPKRPVIKVDADAHDFGKTWVGPTLEHAFTITNAGNATLEITQVKPGCGCTATGSYPPRIEPGQSGKFPFSLHTQSIYGRYEKPISIFSNDSNTPELRLKLRGEVLRAVEVRPPSFFFRTVNPEAPGSQTVTIVNNTESSFEVRLASTSAASQFRFELLPKTPGKVYELRATPLPPFKPGALTGSAVLETTVEAQKTITVSAYGRVPERLDVDPGSILVFKPLSSSPTPRQPMTQILTFTNHGKTPVRVVQATSNDPALKTSVTEKTPGQVYLVHVRWIPGYEPPPEGRTITLKTDDPEKPLLLVPVRGYRSATVSTRPTSVPAARTTTAPQTRRVWPATRMTGRMAPPFSFKTQAGRMVSNADLAGVPGTVLNFTAPNCPYCRRQIPKVERVRAEYELRGFRFIDISGTMANPFTPEQTEAAMRTLGSHMELVLDPQNRISSLFESMNPPTLFVIGPAGRIERVFVGDSPTVESALKSELDRLLRAKQAPAPAAP